MHICIYEDSSYRNFLPLVYLRPVYDLYWGISSIKKSILKNNDKSSITLHVRSELQEHLLDKYPEYLINTFPKDIDDVVFINGRFIFDDNFQFEKLDQNKFISNNNTIVAARLTGRNLKETISKINKGQIIDFSKFISSSSHVDGFLINYLWDLIQSNGDQIKFKASSKGRSKDKIDTSHFINHENIILDKSSSIMPQVVLDGSAGPIIIDKKAIIEPHVYIKGPVYIGPSTLIRSGARIYSGTSIFEGCKIGGEVNNSIIFPFTNKSHEGFLGSSYIGSWVNFGAGSTNSNLKNNYGHVKVFVDDELINTGLQFVGLIMGDHSKCGINTTFNTGTNIGINCNLYGSAMHKKNISSFSWGGKEDGYSSYKLDKALEVIDIVMSRKGKIMTKNEKELLQNIYHSSEK